MSARHPEALSAQGTSLAGRFRHGTREFGTEAVDLRELRIYRVELVLAERGRQLPDPIDDLAVNGESTISQLVGTLRWLLYSDGGFSRDSAFNVPAPRSAGCHESEQ